MTYFPIELFLVELDDGRQKFVYGDDWQHAAQKAEGMYRRVAVYVWKVDENNVVKSEEWKPPKKDEEL